VILVGGDQEVMRTTIVSFVLRKYQGSTVVFVRPEGATGIKSLKNRDGVVAVGLWRRAGRKDQNRDHRQCASELQMERQVRLRRVEHWSPGLGTVVDSPSLSVD
jgi:hypothetical protein